MTEVEKVPLDVGDPAPYQDVPITKEPTFGETSLLTPEPLLEHFGTIDEFLLTRRLKMLETLIGVRMNNKFAIKAGSVHLYRAHEKSGCWHRNCCGALRSFEMNITDYRDTPILNIQRGFVKSCCSYPFTMCSNDSIKVSTGSGTMLGTVKMVNGFWKPTYVIMNANDEVILTLKGPNLVCSLFSDVVFQVVTNSGEVVGEMRKVHESCCRSICVNLDKYSIKFFANITVEMKAMVLAAQFLIDVIYFDRIINVELTEVGVP